MNFGHPKVLWLAASLLPLLALFLWGTWRKRQALVRQFVQNKTLAEVSLSVSPARQKLRRLVLFLGVAFLLAAMAGPQWGFTWEESSQRGRDIIVAIDTSRSMLATDVQPNRLGRAKLAAMDLLKLGQYDRFGLIAFAGGAFLQCPLTFDDEAFRQSVQILEPGIIPQGGTALAQAIQTARDAYGKESAENHKILILFTDGEDHESGINEAVEQAAGDGIRIFTVGAGTPAGELLQVRDERGNLVYVKDESGNVVKSKLNEELLQQIATKANGFYLPLRGGNAMQVLYERGLAPLPTTEHGSRLMKHLKEQFYWPLGAGIILLILELFIPEGKRLRKKPEGLPQAAEGKRSPAAPAVLATLFLLMLTPGAFASAAKAQRQYNAGEYKGALSEYQELIGRNPADPRLHYNAGAAAYQARKYDEAQKEFQAAVGARDLDLQQQAFYNLGNSEFRLGEENSKTEERSAAWSQAIQHYEAALKINSQDKDALYNRDLVRKKLAELKKHQQEQQKDNQKQDNKDNKDQKDKQDKNKQGDKKDQQDNKSGEKQDQNQQQNNKSQDQQDKQNKDQQKKQQEQQNQQQEKQGGEQKDDKGGQPQPKGGKDSLQKNPDNDAATAAQYAQLGKMTPQQAKQLLDAQKGEEKALLFIPKDRKSAGQNHTFKDW